MKNVIWSEKTEMGSKRVEKGDVFYDEGNEEGVLV